MTAEPRRRACMCGRLALPGETGCERHRRRAWGRQPPERAARYADPSYKRNRVLAIRREPVCHWCGERPSTTADHLLSIAKGGTNDLANLVGACRGCNEARGGAEGRRTQKGRGR